MERVIALVYNSKGYGPLLEFHLDITGTKLAKIVEIDKTTKETVHSLDVTSWNIYNDEKLIQLINLFSIDICGLFGK